MAFYSIDFRCRDDDKLQRTLNQLYSYGDDIETKVSHRNRMNLACILMAKLIEGKAMQSLGSAIDIGCNPGAYSKILSDFGFEHVVGIDIADDLVEKANSFFAFRDSGRTLEYRTLNVEEIDTAAKFDFVLCTEVIEHTAELAKVIQNVKDIPAPGGVALITLPNRISFGYLSLLVSSRLAKRKLDEEQKKHLDYPFYSSLKLCRDRGLQTILTSGTHLILSGKILRFLYRTPAFGAANWLDFHLSRLFPLKYFTRVFFIVLKRQGP